MEQKLVTEPGKVAGIVFEFGGQKYIVPALNIEGVEQHEEDIEKVQRDTTLSLKDKTGLICAIAVTAMQRNYPEVRLEFAKKWIDMRNMLPVFQAILGQSGYAEAPSGEAEGVSNGRTSTPA